MNVAKTLPNRQIASITCASSQIPPSLSLRCPLGSTTGEDAFCSAPSARVIFHGFPLCDGTAKSRRRRSSLQSNTRNTPLSTVHLLSSELIGSLKLGNAWVFVQLIPGPTRTETLLNLRLLTTISYRPCFSLFGLSLSSLNPICVCLFIFCCCRRPAGCCFYCCAFRRRHAKTFSRSDLNKCEMHDLGP